MITGGFNKQENLGLAFPKLISDSWCILLMLYHYSKHVYFNT